MRLALSESIAWTIALLLSTASASRYTVDELPNQLHNGPVTVETVIEGMSLNGLKISPVANATTWEWWYFGVISTASMNESATVVFYNAGPEGFSNGLNTTDNSPLYVVVSGTFANGTHFNYRLPATLEAEITEGCHGLNNSLGGVWKGSGAEFHSSGLTDEDIFHTISIDAPQTDVKGTIKMISRAPARSSCGPNAPGQSENVFLDVNWVNAVPDADAFVDLKIHGERVRFTGLGYHDHNWGSNPFRNNVLHTYWGHARVGPYSVVFSQVLGPQGPVQDAHYHVSVSVARDGTALLVSCEPGTLEMRPWGANADFPPTQQTPPPDGILMKINLGHEGILTVNMTRQLTVTGAAQYNRMVGTAVGGIDGLQQFEGKAAFEQFKFIPA